MKIGFVGGLLCAGLFAGALSAAAQSTPGTAGPATFETADQAADALIAAAATFDVAAIERIFGAGNQDLAISGDTVQDKARATDFATMAHERRKVTIDPKNKNRATVTVGGDEWPFPVPIVRKNNRWSFDASAGRTEIVNRRIGENELDAIEVCRGVVEAQHEYAISAREITGVNQYAQRIISTPGKKDGLAWQNPDGSWGGPVGEAVARAIAQGYTETINPYHGYYYKVLTGQGPAAPLGELDFVIKGVMIGGFALVAAPADYAVSGVQTFIVSHDGIVYQKDFGDDTLNAFKAMTRFNPDKTWTPVAD